MALQPVTFEDFSGGLADLYIGTDINKQSKIDNWILDETNKPYVRDGSFIFQSQLPGISGVNPTGLYVGSIPFSRPIVVQGADAYGMNFDYGWAQITGPGAGSFLPTKTDQQYESSVQWRRQIISCVGVTGLPPARIFCSSFTNTVPDVTHATVVATYGVRTLGLPPLASTPTGTGTGTSSNFIYTFFYKYTFADYLGTIFIEFGNPNLPGYLKLNLNAPDVNTITLAAIPDLANTTLTNYDLATSAATSTTFVSGSNQVTVVSATGIVLGAQMLNSDGSATCPNVPIGTLVTAINGTTLTLSAFATNSTSASTTYTSLTIQIARTVNGGTVFFNVDQIANSMTGYADSISDVTLQTQGTIYTSGGALGYDQPPTGAIAVAQTNDFFWFATPTTLYQSIQGAPGACPSSFSDQIDQRIVTLSDIISFPILFCDRSVYRVEGNFDSFGNNGFVLRNISLTAGCVCPSSVVKTPLGLFWFGNGGIFHTDGYRVQTITNHLNASYLNWSKGNVTGTYDSVKNLVYWTVSSIGGTSCDSWVVLHLNYGIKPESVFTTGSSHRNLYPSTFAFGNSTDLLISDSSFTAAGLSQLTVGSKSIENRFRPNYPPPGSIVSGIGVPFGSTVTQNDYYGTQSVKMSLPANQTVTSVVSFTGNIYKQFYQKVLFTDSRGYFLWFDRSSLSDPWISTILYPANMVKKPIIYDLTTAGLDQGIKGFRKYNPDISMEIDAQTPVSIQVRHRRDDGGGGWSGEGGSPPSGKGTAGTPGGGSTGNPGVPEIRQDGAINWNLTDCAWLSDTNEFLWNDFATVTGKRSTPAGQIRSAYKQLKFTNAFTVICGSDQYGNGTVTVQSGFTLPTITLNNFPTQTWPTDLEGYWITFSSDSYNQTYLIQSTTTQTLTLLDPFSRLVAGSQKWEIKGFRKFEKPRLLNFTLNAEVEGPTFGQSNVVAGANSS